MSKQANIPTSEELAKLLDKVRQDKPYGIRDYTILHFSYYAGLRAKEIAKLMLQDVYEDGEIKEEAYLESARRRRTVVTRRGQLDYQRVYSAQAQLLPVRPSSAKTARLVGWSSTRIPVAPVGKPMRIECRVPSGPVAAAASVTSFIMADGETWR